MEAGSGPQLFERSEFCGPPPESSTAGCPQRSEGTQTVGSPFLCLLSFGEAKESESAAGRISRPRERTKSPSNPDRKLCQKQRAQYPFPVESKK